MSEQQGGPLSPTLSKVLDAYLDSLKADGGIDNDAALRLDRLLRQGKVPKISDIDEALMPTKMDSSAS